MKKLTDFQMKILTEMATSPQKIGMPPSGYRGAGADASRWWRAVLVLRDAGLVARMEGKNGTHEITAAGLALVAEKKAVQS